MERWFDLNGASLLVIAEDDALVAPLLPYLGELSRVPSPPPVFVLNISRNGEHGAPVDAELLLEGSLPEGKPCRLVEAGDTRWLDVAGELLLRFSLSQRTATCWVRPGSENLLGGTPAILAIETALHASRQHLLHAAALRLPGSETGFVLFARSGAGKTTTALALALSGFGFLTDDATVLTPPNLTRGNAFKIWGLPRALKVHHRTCELLPRIAPLLGPSWNADGEQVLTRETLKAVAEVCPPRPFPLAAIVMLQPRIDGAHVMRRVEKTELIAHLADDNVRRGPKGMLSDQISRFQALAAVVAATPSFALQVGSDLSSLGSAVASVIGTSLPPRAPKRTS